MAAVKSKPRSTRNRSKGTSPETNAAATGVASGAGSQAGEAGDAVASQPQSRSLAQAAVGRPLLPRSLWKAGSRQRQGALTQTGPKQLRRMLGRNVGRFDLPLSATTQMISEQLLKVAKITAMHQVKMDHEHRAQVLLEQLVHASIRPVPPGSSGPCCCPPLSSLGKIVPTMGSPFLTLAQAAGRI